MIRSFCFSTSRGLYFRTLRVCPLTGLYQVIDAASKLSPPELERAIKDIKAFKALVDAEGKELAEVKL